MHDMPSNLSADAQLLILATSLAKYTYRCSNAHPSSFNRASGLGAAFMMPASHESAISDRFEH